MLRAIRLDLTTLLLWGGALVLFLTVRSPYAAGASLAEGERQALVLVRTLVTLDSAGEALAPPLDLAARERIRSELHARCEAAGLPHTAWPELLPQASDDGVVLQASDWMLLLASTPSLPGEPAADPGTTPREAWAWPRRQEARFTTVFCVAGGQTLSARNLTRRYLGERRTPEPGGWRRRAREQATDYWGVDGQFWRPHP